jgi:hypothetical protein
MATHVNGAGSLQPDPTIDLNWNEYKGGVTFIDGLVWRF